MENYDYQLIVHSRNNICREAAVLPQKSVARLYIYIERFSLKKKKYFPNMRFFNYL